MEEVGFGARLAVVVIGFVFSSFTCSALPALNVCFFSTSSFAGGILSSTCISFSASSFSLSFSNSFSRTSFSLVCCISSIAAFTLANIPSNDEDESAGCCAVDDDVAVADMWAVDEEGFGCWAVSGDEEVAPRPAES